LITAHRKESTRNDDLDKFLTGRKPNNVNSLRRELSKEIRMKFEDR